VYGQHNAVAEGPAPGARCRAATTAAVVRRDGGRQRNRDHDSGRRSPSRDDKVVGRNWHARRGGRRRDDHDRGNHVDHQPHDHADEND